jgi:hypothetical protein
LLENADKGAGLSFAVIGYDATGRSAPHDDMTSALSGDDEPERFES